MTGFLVLCGVLLVLAFVTASVIDIVRSPEFKRDLQRAREMRRVRAASRRS